MYERFVNNKISMIWTVRPTLLDTVIAKWGLDYKVLDVSKYSEDHIGCVIASFLK